MKYLEYDPVSGNAKDAITGALYFVAINLNFVEFDANSSSVDEMIKLKNAGFTAQEIIEMRKAGL